MVTIKNPLTVVKQGVNVVQDTGTSTTDVMSQNAVTSMVFADPAYKQRIRIGNAGSVNANYAVVIGEASSVGSSASGTVAIGEHSTVATGASGAMAIGRYASVGNAATNSIALGYGAKTTVGGEFNIGTSGLSSTQGYNRSAYRLLTGVYPGQSEHDAAIVGQLPATLTNSQFNSIMEAV